MDEQLDLDIMLKPSEESYFDRQSRLFQEQKQKQEAGRVGLDLRDRAFPRVELGKDKYSVFEFPLEIENAEPKPVYGLRGVIVDYGHGMHLYDTVANKYICRSVGAYRDDGMGNTELMRKSAAAVFPIPSAEKYGQKGVPHERVEMARLLGKRGKTCAECIASGEHVLEGGEVKVGEDGGDGSPQMCKSYGSVLMYVTHVLLMLQGKTQEVEGRRVMPTKYVWAKLASEAEGDEMVWRSEFGEPYYEHPILVQVQIPSAAARYIVTEVDTAKGKKVQRLHTTSYVGSQANTLSKSHTPGDVLPWRTFIEEMLKNHRDAFAEFAPKFGGTEHETIVLKKVVEMYATRPIVTVNGEPAPPKRLATIPTLRWAEVVPGELNAVLKQALETYVQGLQAAEARLESRRAGEEEPEFFEAPANSLPVAAEEVEEPSQESAANLLQNTVASRFRQRG